MKCNVCPRGCNIDRTNNTGFCGMMDKIAIRKVMIHKHEEPILTTEKESGSGAIFFAGCNLKCVYCQNYDVSHSSTGLEITPSQLADLFKQLELNGAGNIDLVSPTHYTNQIIEALKIYKPKVPVVWNTGGYESPETIKKLDGLVDIYLTDFKYADNTYALKYSKASNYVENAKTALIEMKKQVPNNIFDGDKLVKGIVIRHMVIPSLAKDSIQVLNIINEILGKDAIVSIMSQYTPIPELKDKYEKINRRLTRLEYKTVVSHALKLGLNNAFTQDLESASCDYTPQFNENIIDIKIHQV